jgi:hypothetical protein
MALSFEGGFLLQSARLPAILIKRSPAGNWKRRGFVKGPLMKRFAALFLALVTGLVPTPARAAKRPMKIDDLFRFKRVSDPQISPDGNTVAYVVTTVDRKGNKSSSNIWLAPTAKRKLKRGSPAN